MGIYCKHLSPAEKTLQELGISEPVEIDLEVIAMHVGAIVNYKSLSDCEARIVGNDEKAIITIDSNRHPFRQRFSIGHELGHWHFHRGKNFICRPNDIGNPSRSITDPERVADRYAADLLLPRYMFVPLSAGMHTNLQSVDELAQRFHCSRTAAAIRMVEHGPEPAILICHSIQGRRWFVRNRDVPEKWFPKKKLDQESYVYDVQFGTNTTCKRGSICADAWFDAEGADKHEVFEEAIKSPKNETLTLITFKNDGMLDE